MRKLVLFSGLLAFCSAALASDCVILLHGMARTKNSMNKMEDILVKADYRVVNYGYPSTEKDIYDIAKDHVPEAIDECDDAQTIHFVTHSLGGIVLRAHLKTTRLDRLGKVVMLGPPNQGSEVVDHLKDVPGFEWINGPAGMELGTDQNSVPNSLGPVDYPVGVIAGSSTFNPILSQMLPNPDDGKVSVERTKVEGMLDHIVVPVSHPFLMRDDDVIRQVMVFLKAGVFDHGTNNSSGDEILP